MLAAAYLYGISHLHGISHIDFLEQLRQNTVSFGPERTSSDMLIWYSALAIIAAPLCEEFIFRGVLYRGFRCSFSAKPAAAEASSPAPNTLGAARIALLNVARASLATAFDEWALSGTGNDCILVFAESEEWLVGCRAEASGGFAPTGETWSEAPVLWNPESLRMSEQLLPYREIATRLVGTVAVSSSDDGAVRPVLLVQDWWALRTNHPGFQDSPVEEWLGIVVHEGFHARQQWHPRVRPLQQR